MLALLAGWKSWLDSLASQCGWKITSDNRIVLNLNCFRQDAKCAPQRNRGFRLLSLTSLNISINHTRFLSYNGSERIWLGWDIKMKNKGGSNMESLSGKLFVMIRQTEKYWITDYLSLFFGSYFSIALQSKTSLPGRQARSRADKPFWMIFFDVIRLICL